MSKIGVITFSDGRPLPGLLAMNLKFQEICKNSTRRP